MSLLDAIPHDLDLIMQTDKGLASGKNRTEGEVPESSIYFRPVGSPDDGSQDIPVRAIYSAVTGHGPSPGGTAGAHSTRKELLVHLEYLPSVPARSDFFIVDGVVYNVILCANDGYGLLTISLGQRAGRNIPLGVAP